MNELISVIVPVYNVKGYLVACVDSIIRQSYKNLEIILIDDGSTDGSSELCDVLGKKDQRIVVVHKINGGLSDARNAGMKIAKGMFWAFVDSDDTIEKDMIEILYQNAKKYNADISMCKSNHIKNNTLIKKECSNKIDIYIGKERIIKYLFNQTGPSIAVCLKLYEASKHKFIFPVGKTSEDAFVILDTINEDSRLVVNDIGKYNYRLRDGSITRQKSYHHSLMDCYYAYKNNYTRIIKENPNCERVAARRLIWSIARTMWTILNTNDYFKHKIKLKYLQKQLWINRKMWLTNNACNYIDKGICILAVTSIQGYRLIRQFIERFRLR